MYIIYQENGDYLKKKLCIHFFVSGRATNSHLYKLKANKKERKKKTTELPRHLGIFIFISYFFHYLDPNHIFHFLNLIIIMYIVLVS